MREFAEWAGSAVGAIVAPARLLRRFLFGSRGNVSPLIALMLVPIIGALGMGAEGGTFFLSQRAMQNTADAAVLAAAQNGCASTDGCATSGLSPTYDVEAKAVAAKMGFPNGGDIVVTSSNAAPCPAGGNTCFSVTIAKKVPFYLLKVVGFRGDATTSGGVAAQTVRAGALASLQAGSGFCVTAYGNGTSGNSAAVSFQGASSLDLSGCDLAVPNGGASCNGQSGNTIRYAYVGNAGDGKNCGTEQVKTFTAPDNYASLSSSVPTNSCPSYPQSGNPRGQDNVPAGVNRIGTAAGLGPTPLCGDVVLTANISVTSDTVMTIFNGRLDLAGHTLQTTGTGHLTIILSGTALSGTGQNNADHQILSTSSGGVIDIAAPSDTSNTWHGVALYQDDARLTGAGNNLTMNVTGSTPQWDITGLVYAPKATLNFSGAINHATSGVACLAFMVNSFDINGTGSLFAYPTRQCDRAGLTGLGKVNNRSVLVG